MSKAGSRILTSARQALAYAKGETTEGFADHVPGRIDAERSRLPGRIAALKSLGGARRPTTLRISQQTTNFT